MKNKILIIGAGSWGTAIANTLAKENKVVDIWTRNLKISHEINKKNTNKKYFKKIKLQKNLNAISGAFDISEYFYIFYVLPAGQFEYFIKNYLNTQIINNFIICSKGLSTKGQLISVVAKTYLKLKNLYILSGPSFAEEVIKGLPTALSISSNRSPLPLGKLFKGTNIRIYYSKNYKTLEVLGVIKNIYAIGAGIIDSLCLGENARAAYIARCIVEIQFILKNSKLDKKQILTLGGVGDLILTCSSKKSRNYSFGYNLINLKNKNMNYQNKKTIEGLNSIFLINKNLELDINNLPILKSISNIVNGKPSHLEINKLFSRKFKYE
ncbi:hypothetical protein N9T39_00310 [bacterium]|nr:hypothetical protein [bacterium]